jgi:glucose/mannose transport system permease protein
MSKSERPNPLFRNLNAKVASIPMILTASVVFVGGTVWTVIYSFTNSKLLPRLNFVGLDQYYRLWATPRWLISIENLLIYGAISLVFSLVIGFLLAALLDQKIRFEDTFRTKALANSFRSELVKAANNGQPFDTESGRPWAEARAQQAVTW